MIEVTFWGVRGTNPVSGRAFEKIGHHTSCVSVRVNQDQLIIFDAGSGLYELGREYSPSSPKVLHILLSHLHLDHIMGLPFFMPLWDKKYIVNIYSSNNDLEDVLKAKLLHPPIFPISANSTNSNLIFHKVSMGETFQIETSYISTFSLNHPGGSIGYRLDAEGRSICYITDVEHDPEFLDEKLVKFVRGTDLLIYDASYTEEEYMKRRGWGHSTHSEAAKIAKAAGVKQLALFHQNPTHDDRLSGLLERQAQALFENTIAAYQGLTLRF